MGLFRRHKRISAGSGADRAAIMVDLSGKGWSPMLAGLVAMALFPLDDSHPPGTLYQGIARDGAVEFMEAAEGKSMPEIVELARDTVGQYRQMAILMGEDYYGSRFDEILSSS